MWTNATGTPITSFATKWTVPRRGMETTRRAAARHAKSGLRRLCQRCYIAIAFIFMYLAAGAADITLNFSPDEHS
jgi:hypothetical protein